jgi:hypothetical protein
MNDLTTSAARFSFDKFLPKLVTNNSFCFINSVYLHFDIIQASNIHFQVSRIALLCRHVTRGTGIKSSQ